MVLLQLRDNDTKDGQLAYEHALRLYQQGRLEAANSEAAAGWVRYRQLDPKLAGAYQLLDARTLLFLGQYEDALKLLAWNPDPGLLEDEIQRLSLQASVNIQLGKLQMAEQHLARAEALCGKADFAAYSGVLTTRGSLARRLGNADLWRSSYEQAFTYARNHHDPWRQVNAAVTLGHSALLGDHPDEAIEWSRTAYQMAVKNGYDDLAQEAVGNEGYAWYQLGDGERAQQKFEAAERAAAGLEDFGDEQTWLSNQAYVYRDRGDLDRAEKLDRQALALAQKIGNKDEEADTLGDLAELAILAGRLDEADARLQAALRIEMDGNHNPRPYDVLLKGELAAGRHEYAKSEESFRDVLSDKTNSTAMRLTAGNDLGRMYEEMGKYAPAERMYKATIATWYAAREQLKPVELRLSYGTNASQIYRSYVRFLVERGKTAEALAVADQSRARTLAEGLGIGQTHERSAPEAPHPEQIARKTGATLLFYWLGEKESYLWAITPEKTAFTRLPAEKEIVARVARYNRAIQELRDPAERANADGLALYATLVAPAGKAMEARRPVIVLTDGALSELNFETLLARDGPGAKPHYLIEDATLLSAPSLDLLAHAGAAQAGSGQIASAKAGSAERSLLLVGNPTAADVDFPPLPLFDVEMKRIAHHFDAGETAVFAGARATPAAYEAANPGRYAYIHFVSHATASRASPLDSAIILSNPVAQNTGSPVSAYKLYAREIVLHPLTARLVTISACNGSGTRAYAGEGLVGLSWAFLRAGARQVVAALWEVSDESNPRLMDGLYKGIEAGERPAEALREAKLRMLHPETRDGSRFTQPFYWAALQVYSRE